MDRETKEILSEADHVKSMLDSNGWKSVYGKLSEKLLDLQNIHNLDMTQPETLNTQLAARKMAIEIVWAWLKNDVFGFVEQQEANNKKADAQNPESYIGIEPLDA